MTDDTATLIPLGVLSEAAGGGYVDRRGFWDGPSFHAQEICPLGLTNRRPGDLLRSHDGRWVAVQAVTDSGEDAMVYGLRVAEYHTYFVGSREWGFSVWVHNTSNRPAPSGRGNRASTLRPGPYAEESIPARGPGRDYTVTERQQINEIGRTTGCHTCGATNPGTASGNFIPDHQPPSALNPPGGPQQLYPHCLECSRAQGGEVRSFLR